MSNVEGSVIVYFCDEGLSPEGKMNATCFSNGSWIPNPAELLCLNSHHDSEGLFSVGCKKRQLKQCT